MATIKDVAKAANVSISTVSYALNDDSRIPEVTASRIKIIANEIGYFPSAAARNLKKRTTNTILVAISDFGGPVYHELLDGIHNQLTQEGYTMVVSTGISSEKLLKERSADGAIISDIHITNESLLKIGKNFGPIIMLDRDLEGMNIYNMTIDNKSAMEELTKKIIKTMRKRIAFVHGVKHTYDNQTRYLGFLQAMNQAKMPIFKEYQGNFTTASGISLIHTLMKEQEELPDVFVCANDEMAIGIMDTLKEYGKKIPSDVGVSGFDDIQLASYYTPNLSTVKILHNEWGKAAAKAAIKIIKKEPVEITKQKGDVIVRQSF